MSDDNETKTEIAIEGLTSGVGQGLAQGVGLALGLVLVGTLRRRGRDDRANPRPRQQAKQKKRGVIGR